MLHGSDQNSLMNQNHLMEMQHHLNLQENQYPQFQLKMVALASLESLAYELVIPYDLSCNKIQFLLHILWLQNQQ